MSLPPGLFWALFLAVGVASLALAKRLDDRDGRARSKEAEAAPPART